ncbi:MAG TPA: PQQ-binding-like beta-propeller repeat protein [Solirubrobacterales bacterium]|nr:PQQ-binding-like beta-propeller repeat protein [Solirubrobacterales bacterium]
MALFAVALAVVAGCGGGSDDSGSDGGATLDGTGYPGIDNANTRSADSTIKRDNATSLAVAWKLPLTAESSFGAYASTPVIANGVVYSQDLESNVQAIDLESGEVLWTKRYEEPTGGPNGVAVAEGKVFGATANGAFALDQETGKELWSVELVKNAGGEAIDMAPGTSEGLVYVSTVPAIQASQYPGGGVGTLYALDANSGKEKWSFNTVPPSLWGDKKQNSGGGLWYPPSFDGKGSMYFGTGNPAPFPGTPSDPWGKSRPGPNLYTNSVVKLDAKTGKLDWFYQQTPHDLYDWDFQNPPVLVSAGGKELAIGSGKSGFVTALDAKTGKPVWSTPVGKHNGRDDDGLLAMRGEYSKLKDGLVYPGYLGGVIAPISTNQTAVFVPVVNAPVTVSKGTTIAGAEPEGPGGEVVALDLATGKELWNAEFEGAAYGSTTATNDLVFATSFEGIVHAFDAKTGGEVWSGQLPAGTNSGVSISGDTLIAAAGLAVAEGQKPQIVAYRLGGEGE